MEEAPLHIAISTTLHWRMGASLERLFCTSFLTEPAISGQAASNESAVSATVEIAVMNVVKAVIPDILSVHSGTGDPRRRKCSCLKKAGCRQLLEAADGFRGTRRHIER